MYIKAALQIAKNGTPINRKAKEQDRAEKANTEVYGSYNALNRTEQNHIKQEPSEKWK